MGSNERSLSLWVTPEAQIAPFILEDPDQRQGGRFCSENTLAQFYRKEPVLPGPFHFPFRESSFRPDHEVGPLRTKR